MPPNIRLPPSNASASENMLLRLFFFLSSSKSGVAQEGIQLSSLNAMPSLPVTVIKGKSILHNHLLEKTTNLSSYLLNLSKYLQSLRWKKFQQLELYP